MRLLEYGVPCQLGLGTPVYYTHRATAMLADDMDHRYKWEHPENATVVVPFGIPRDLVRRDRQRPYGYGGHRYGSRAEWAAGRSPHDLRPPWHMARPPLVSTSSRGRALTPRHLHRWVFVWPEPGYATVVGLTYRSSGWVTPSSGRDEDFEQGFLTEHGRYPLYEVKERLVGSRMLVPPWACVPLPTHVVHGLDYDDPPLRIEEIVEAWLGTAPVPVPA